MKKYIKYCIISICIMFNPLSLLSETNLIDNLILTNNIIIETNNVIHHKQIGEKTSWGIPLAPCFWCGTSNINDNIQVHHKIPQAECKRIKRLDLIYNSSNMVCLCRTDGKGCHFYIGHHGVSWDYVFTNIESVLKLK